MTSPTGDARVGGVGSSGRRLVVVRHAKAEGYAADDHARQLTDRGRRDAVEAGRWLAAEGIVPDHAFVSSAARAMATWQALADQLGAETEVVVDDALYSAGPEEVLEALRSAPEDAGVVCFVGHNPTAAYLAHLLDDGDPDPAAFRELSEGYPTAALTVLDVPVAWADLRPACAHIAAFHVGDGSAAAR
jgi:phosphohistidine phosphatase